MSWESKEIVDDPRIDHDSWRTRVAAERLHSNESIDKHHRIGDVVCVYCALRASTALRAVDALSVHRS